MSRELVGGGRERRKQQHGFLMLCVLFYCQKSAPRLTVNRAPPLALRLVFQPSRSSSLPPLAFERYLFQPVNKSKIGDGKDQAYPVYVGEFPQVIRDEQINHLHRPSKGQVCVAGGMDKKMNFCEVRSTREQTIF